MRDRGWVSRMKTVEAKKLSEIHEEDSRNDEKRRRIKDEKRRNFDQRSRGSRQARPQARSKPRPVDEWVSAPQGNKVAFLLSNYFFIPYSCRIVVVVVHKMFVVDAVLRNRSWK